MESPRPNIPFLTNDKKFALGVEFGMLYKQLQLEQPSEFDATIHSENDEQVIVMASNLGYQVTFDRMETWTVAHFTRL